MSINPFKLKYYFELIELAFFIKIAIYDIPLDTYYGKDYLLALHMMMWTLLGLLIWQDNNTFHYLLEKYGLKRK